MASLRSPGVGLDDRQIHDLVNCVAYFAYVNRVVAGLGVLPGGREGKPGQSRTGAKTSVYGVSPG